MFAGWLVLAALGGPLETDRVPGVPVTLSTGVVIERVLGQATWSADRMTVVVARVTATGSELVLLRQLEGRWSEPQVLVSDHHPDRPTLDPEGRRLAYVKGPIAGIWLLDLSTGSHHQLTNHQDTHQAGQPPAGWVPVPHADPVRFEGDSLVWQSPQGPHRLDLP